MTWLYYCIACVCIAVASYFAGYDDGYRAGRWNRKEK